MARIALLFALSREMAPAVRRLRARPAGEAPAGGLRAAAAACGPHEILLAASGMGARRAAHAAAALLDGWAPDLLVIAGIGAALSPELRAGEVLAAQAVVSGDERLLPSCAPAPGHIPCQQGLVLSLDRVLVTPAEKRAALVALRSRDPEPLPTVAEMETASAARAARARGIPWAALRAVSDTAHEPLPLDFNHFRKADGNLCAGRLAVALLRRPAALPGLLRLGRNADAAAEALANALAAWLPVALPPSGRATERL